VVRHDTNDSLLAIVILRRERREACRAMPDRVIALIFLRERALGSFCQNHWGVIARRSGRSSTRWASSSIAHAWDDWMLRFRAAWRPRGGARRFRLWLGVCRQNNLMASRNRTPQPLASATNQQRICKRPAAASRDGISVGLNAPTTIAIALRQRVAAPPFPLSRCAEALAQTKARRPLGPGRNSPYRISPT